MNRLLLTSEQSRRQLNPIISNVDQCVDINYDVSQFQAIANQRSSELASASALQANLISNGALLKADLIRALRISLRIDNKYLAWARQQNSGCTGTNSIYYNQALTLDGRATTDKQNFVDRWDPVASQYGLHQFQASDI
jgi:hypothetical protein